MKYCKKCDCGHVNVYEVTSPFRCESCGRKLIHITQEEYIPAEEKSAEEKDTHPTQEATESKTPALPVKDDEKGKTKTPVFIQSLESCDGKCIISVDGAVTVGRNSAGKEYLGLYEDVSREHFHIISRPNGIAATLKDISSFGTYVNGKRIQKNSPVFITDGATIRLASEATLIFKIKEV